MNNTIKSSLLILTLAASASAFADNQRVYEVTVTNLTKGIAFTPFLGATHKKGMQLFRLGHAASDNVANVAEGGDISGLKDELDNTYSVASTAASAGLLTHGQSVTFTIDGQARFNHLSLISMLLPTNDTMVSLRGKKLPKQKGQVVHYRMHAYDAGTEVNSELCSDIPGPQCGGNPFSVPAASDEGYVYPSPGIHGEADLSRFDYGWQAAVAKVKIKRIN
ncbi:spondin domain-containing protein [Shewanella marina]|uniref:spondin domain-containing protein n=1 Tax=Shewanella marina TaxID=487319 RepID=UPI0004711EDC|nr:spondin domain-containing protein [Shewanella marina]